jgi:hypothetical protein
MLNNVSQTSINYIKNSINISTIFVMKLISMSYIATCIVWALDPSYGHLIEKFIPTFQAKEIVFSCIFQNYVTTLFFLLTSNNYLERTIVYRNNF